MSGYQQFEFPFLVDGSGNLIGVKMMDGREVPFAQLTPDGRSLAMPDGTPFTPVIAPNIQKVAPASGGAVQMADTALDGTLYVNPAAALAALTITLPTEANSRLGQIRRIATSKAITALTINGATLLSTITSLNAGDCVSFLKIDANTWTRIV